MKDKKLTKEKIIRILNEHKNELKRYTANKVGIFGSYAQDKQQGKSDIDFVVEFGNPSLDNYMGLVAYLEGLFKRKVDILTPLGVESIRVKRVADEIKRRLIYV